MQQIVVLALIVVVACSGNQEESFEIPTITDFIASKDTLENQSCDTVFCALGKECVMKKKQAVCECIEKCVRPYRPVCGSNGATMKTYKSECHLFKAACEQENSTITMVAETSCEKVESDGLELSKKIQKDDKKVKPVVCMEKDRDSVRLAIIKWISRKSNFDVEDISYKGILLKYFLSLDTDKDNALDTMEFMKLLEEDDSMTKVLDQASSNPILKGLCSTELIAITDINSDYKLEFDEFHQCLDPVFEPPKDKCELRGAQFKDGEDIPAECNNTCKCACGHWVCTHVPCTKDEDGNDISDQLPQNDNTE